MDKPEIFKSDLCVTTVFVCVFETLSELCEFFYFEEVNRKCRSECREFDSSACGLSLSPSRSRLLWPDTISCTDPLRTEPSRTEPSRAEAAGGAHPEPSRACRQSVCSAGSLQLWVRLDGGSGRPEVEERPAAGSSALLHRRSGTCWKSEWTHPDTWGVNNSSLLE